MVPSTFASIPADIFPSYGKKVLLFVYSNTDLKNIPYNYFVVCREAPDFTLPNHIQHIEPEAFQGIAARWIYISDGCLSIGDRAFYNISNLRQIRIPDYCSLEESILREWNEQIVIIGTPGSTAEEYASGHYNFAFLSELEYNRLNAYH